MITERKEITLEDAAGGTYEITHPDHEKPIFMQALGCEKGQYLINAFDTNSGKLISKKIGTASSIENLSEVFYQSVVTYAKVLAETGNYAFQDNTKKAKHP